MDNGNNNKNTPETSISLNKKSQDDGNTLLSVSAAARLLGVHPNTVRIWTESGVLQSYRIGPRKDRRIPASVVKCMLESE
jgi:excisionase family DNA binding protein